MLWAMCPKVKFCGVHVVKLAAALTAIRFYHGSIMYGHVLEEIGIPQGPYTFIALQAMDAARVAAGERKASERSKQARKRRRRVRKGIEDELQQAEKATFMEQA